MYVVYMNADAQYMQGEYNFAKKSEVQNFLEGLSNGQLEKVTGIEKYNKSSYKNVYYDFFN